MRVREGGCRLQTCVVGIWSCRRGFGSVSLGGVGSCMTGDAGREERPAPRLRRAGTEWLDSWAGVGALTPRPRHCMQSLESIFRGSEDIHVRLPEDSARFKAVHAAFMVRSRGLGPPGGESCHRRPWSGERSRPFPHHPGKPCHDAPKRPQHLRLYCTGMCAGCAALEHAVPTPRCSPPCRAPLADPATPSPVHHPCCGCLLRAGPAGGAGAHAGAAGAVRQGGAGAGGAPAGPEPVPLVWNVCRSAGQAARVWSVPRGSMCRCWWPHLTPSHCHRTTWRPRGWLALGSTLWRWQTCSTSSPTPPARLLS